MAITTPSTRGFFNNDLWSLMNFILFFLMLISDNYFCGSTTIKNAFFLRVLLNYPGKGGLDGNGSTNEKINEIFRDYRARPSEEKAKRIYHFLNPHIDKELSNRQRWSSKLFPQCQPLLTFLKREPSS